MARSKQVFTAKVTGYVPVTDGLRPTDTIRITLLAEDGRPIIAEVKRDVLRAMADATGTIHRTI